MQGKIEIAVKSDVGKERTENQDHFGVYQPAEPEVARVKGSLVVVADGMGGHSGGKIASETAVNAILEAFKKSQHRSMRELLNESVQAANDAVRTKQREDVRIHDAGTTCVALMIRGSLAVVAHLGDSRCYLFRNDKVERVTRDHTYLNELIDLGILTPEQAQGHPDRNIITRCVGMSTKLEIEFNRRELKNGDVLLMCSDGLSNFVSDQEMMKLSRDHAPDVAAEKLIQLANDRGGEDNITVAIAKVHTAVPGDAELTALDADESLFSARVAPVIKLADAAGASEPDTAENPLVPESFQKTKESKIPKHVTTAQPIANLITQESIVGGGSSTAATTSVDRRQKILYFVIGVEILVLVVLCIWLVF